jgi:hypothetical protein
VSERKTVTETDATSDLYVQVKPEILQLRQQLAAARKRIRELEQDGDYIDTQAEILTSCVNENDQLRQQLVAANERAEAAEAKIGEMKCNECRALVQTWPALLTANERALAEMRKCAEAAEAQVTDLARTMETVRDIAEMYAVCGPGVCKECDLLRHIEDVARRALGREGDYRCLNRCTSYSGRS